MVDGGEGSTIFLLTASFTIHHPPSTIHMKSAVIVFPGSNCDRDATTVLGANKHDVVKVWHRDTTLPKVDLVMLPGWCWACAMGFRY